ncbi:MAG TPA: PAS domain-containing protein, partial [Myxococcota bacterium]|nr:PAS domain-containing protein [Myxococcota bacterium]
MTGNAARSEGEGDREVRSETRLNAGPAIFYTMTQTPTGYRADWVSPNVREVLGYTVEEALAPGWWWSNLDEAHRAQVAASQRTLLETGALTHRYRFRAKSGEWVWVRDDL